MASRHFWQSAIISCACLVVTVADQPYDCQDGLSTWKQSWPIEKQMWCCSRMGLGCTVVVQHGQAAQLGDSWGIHCSDNCNGRNVCEQVCNGEQLQTHACAKLPDCPLDSLCPTGTDPVDCVFEDWTEWSQSDDCSGLCYRNRAVKHANRCGGVPCDGALEDSKKCDPPARCKERAQDCEFSSWGGWGRCGENVACQKNRNRKIARPALHGGNECSGATLETSVCGEDCHVATNCEVSVWMEWSGCANSCGGGERTRLRTIVTRALYGGRPCDGPLSEKEGCNEQPCLAGAAADCVMASWSEWTACTTGDQKMRERMIDTPPSGGGKSCEGELAQTVGCGIRAKMVPDTCVMSDWSPWQLCDRTCGGGQTFRTRSLHEDSDTDLCVGLEEQMGTVEAAPCNERPCSLDMEPCRVAAWEAWGDCSTTCGSGQESRVRQIVAEASAGGMACQLPLEETRRCPGLRQTCTPTDCQWGEWDNWSECSVSCGGLGQQTRHRSFDQEATIGGQPCRSAEASQVRPCGETPCHLVVCVDGEWGDYSDWSSCTRSCRGGLRWHSRHVALEANRCGKPPQGNSTEVEVCNADVECSEDQDCKLSSWSEWSQCDSHCKGTQTRIRRVIERAKGFGTCGEDGPAALQEVRGCRGAMDGTSACGNQPKENCTFSNWGAWAECSVTCGGGQTVRMRRAEVPGDSLLGRRLVDTVPAYNCSQDADKWRSGWAIPKQVWCCQHAGVGCTNNIHETHNCTEGVNDFEALWSVAKKMWCCDKKSIGCDEGKTLKIDDSFLCVGPTMVTDKCNDFECDVSVVDCRYGEWSDWSACSKCVAGHQVRTREVLTQAENSGRACDPGQVEESRPCPNSCGPKLFYCVWGDWTDDSTCSKSCGSASKKRRRKMELTDEPLDNPMAVASDNKQCDGELTQYVHCENNPSCADVCEPIDCLLSEWNEWSAPTCEGICKRFRTVRRTNNDCGSPCDGVLNQTKSCPADCSSKDCLLSEWTGWSACANELDQSYKTRKILRMPSFNGMGCSGVLNLTGSCKTGPDAPSNCELSDWSDWSECDCNTGQHVKSRIVVNEARNGGSPCDGVLLVARGCSMKDCASERDTVTNADCDFGAWSLWSKCAGDGDQQVYRTRFVSRPVAGVGKACEGPVRETRGCHVDVSGDSDCAFSTWSKWSACPVSCGGGQYSRSRSIQEHAVGGGKRCSGPLLEATACNEEACPGDVPSISCKTSDWSDWDSCSTSCGEGFKARRRSLIQPALSGTINCSLALSETTSCQMRQCSHAKDCVWEQWMMWGDCTPSPDVCGVGYKRRSRNIEQKPEGGGALCMPGILDQVMPVSGCRGQPLCCVDGKWGDWQEWGECSARCGQGTRKRARRMVVRETWCGQPAIGAPLEFQGCEAPGCGQDHDCDFSEWSIWSPCSANCHGNRTRHRQIKTHAMGAGKACRGETESVERCNPADGQIQPWSCEVHTSAPKGPQDCLMSEWGVWTPCSQTCSGGFRKRRRHIQIHPENGGKMCQTSLEEVHSCNENTPCFPGRVDCEWSDWQPWSECNNLRFQFRTRGILAHEQGGGVACSGNVRELEPCGANISGFPSAGRDDGSCQSRDRTCGWSSWAQWEGCTATCGTGGVRKRRRMMKVSDSPLSPIGAAMALDSAQSDAFRRIEARLVDLERHRTQDVFSSFALGIGALSVLALVVRSVRVAIARTAGDYNRVPQIA